MKKMNYVLGLLTAFSLILVLLITSIEAVVYWNPGYFEKEYEKHQVTNDVHMEMDDLLEVTDHMMAYLRGNEEELQIVTTVDGAERGFFSEREIAHMEDVKVLFLGGLNLRYFALAIGTVCLLTLWKRRAMSVLPKSMLAGTGIFLGGVLLIGGLAATDFTKYFTIFHHIFFDNDLWLLDPNVDLLINIVPESFFIDTALRIGIVFGISMAIVLAGSIYLLRKGSIKIERTTAEAV